MCCIIFGSGHRSQNQSRGDSGSGVLGATQTVSSLSAREIRRAQQPNVAELAAPTECIVGGEGMAYYSVAYAPLCPSERDFTL